MLNWLLALASAALLILTFPRFSIVWLAPVALAPLLVAMAREPRWKRRFLLGWSAGVVYWFGVCYWIQFVLSFHGGLGEAAGWAVFLLFCAAKAVHLGVFGALAGMADAALVGRALGGGALGGGGSDSRLARLRLAGAGECRHRYGRARCASRPSPACTVFRSSSP